MDGNILGQETILDHIIAYTIGAAEVIEGNKEPKNTNSLNMALVPFGPPFYTAILQAAGALSIDQKTKTAMIVYKQNKQPKSIQMCNENLGPILGKVLKFPTKLKTIFTSKYDFVKLNKNTRFTQDIENQIYFIRVLTQVDKLVLVGIGSQVTQKNITSVLDDINQISENLAIFFAANFSENKEYEMCREIDEQWISDIIDGKVKKNGKNMISKIFSHYTKKQKKTPQVLAYTNTGDLGGNRKKTNSYACLVA